PSRARVRIVDQDGEPVEGVTLEIDKSILRPLAWEPTSRMRTVTVDGERTIRIGGAFVDDINLTARKEGYYTARRSVRQPRRENVEGLTERAWKDVVLGRETVIDPEEPKLLNVVLELRKKGEIVQLYWFRGTLEIRSDGSGRIIRLHPPEGRRPGRTVIMERQGIVHEVDDVLEHIQESDDPREVAFMVAFEDGEILEKTSKRIGQRDRHFPGNLVFLSSDEEGGFQLSPEQENRLMIEAPEDGYEPKLEVSYSELGDDNLWYYFKADGHYGKMSLGPPNLTLTVDEEGFSWVRYQVTFSLNPTAGDRNLEHGL
ncbi:MAG: carboxypeptidase regulatory-like domain-containing protein, partial [Opitutales bacterium]|nr:carboxypeptidase regulatory-like domain-containing protein [Opitutales bacterium]